MLGPPLAVYTFFVLHFQPRIHDVMTSSNRVFTTFELFVTTKAWGWGSLLALVGIAVVVRLTVRDSKRRATGFFSVLALTLAALITTMTGVPRGGPDVAPREHGVPSPPIAPSSPDASEPTVAPPEVPDSPDSLDSPQLPDTTTTEPSQRLRTSSNEPIMGDPGISTRGRVQIERSERVGGDGRFDNAIVERAVRSRVSSLRLCYEQQLSRVPTLAGTIAIDFSIEPSGAVTAVRATENTTNIDDFGACAAWSVQRYRFNPAPTGGSVAYRYTFGFAPEAR